MPNAPLICWQNLVTETNITTTIANPVNPVQNAANPQTYSVYRPGSASNFSITIATGGVAVDYVGLVVSDGATVGDIGIRADIGGTIVDIVDKAPVEAARALLYKFETIEADSIIIDFEGHLSSIQIGVVRVGESTPMQRRIYVGHTPVTMGRRQTIVGGMSENGQYIGEIVRRRSNATQISLQNLTADWYRDNIEPMLDQVPLEPFFFSWRPDSYGGEVGYCWLTQMPQPSNQRSNGMMQIDMAVEAIV